jgi:diguanylate cyclase (GGDEF)-like protein
LVEDNPGDAMRIRQLASRARSARFSVDSVGSLGAAIERLGLGSIDVVLLDLDLPDSLGLTTLGTLSAAAPAVPVVVLGRSGEEALGVEAVRLGAQDFIPKDSVSAEGLARAARCAIERHRLIASLRGQSLTDELTGLLNRRGFATLAQGLLRLAGRTGQQFLLLFADLDGLKAINDERGHHEGDQALMRVAEVLRQTFRQSDVVARYGGDEFIAIARGASRGVAMTLAERLRDAARTCGASVSIGVAVCPEDGDSEATLIEAADTALYRAKADGRDCVRTLAAA